MNMKICEYAKVLSWYHILLFCSPSPWLNLTSRPLELNQHASHVSSNQLLIAQCGRPLSGLSPAVDAQNLAGVAVELSKGQHLAETVWACQANHE